MSIKFTYWDTPPARFKFEGYKSKTFKKAGILALIYFLGVVVWHDRYTFEELEGLS